MTLGMDLLHVPGATGDYNTNFDAKAKACLENIQSGMYNFGFCHLKAVDDAGHDHDFEKKVYYLEKIDQMIGSVMLDLEKSTDTKVKWICSSREWLLMSFMNGSSIQLLSLEIIQHHPCMVTTVASRFLLSLAQSTATHNAWEILSTHLMKLLLLGEL